MRTRALLGWLTIAATICVAWWLSLQDKQADLRVFYDAGRSVLHGHSPYPELGSAAVYSEHAFVYPIAAVGPFIPLALLPWGVAKAVFFALSVAAAGLAVRLSGARSITPYLAVLLSATFIRGLQLGTLNAFLLAGALLAWRYRDRATVLVPVLAAVVVPKLFLVPLLGWPFVTRRWKATALTVSVVAAVLVAGFTLGPLGAGEYAQLLNELSSRLAQKGWGPYRVLLDVTGAATAARAGAWALACLVLAASFAWYLRHRAEIVLFSGAIVAAVLASPIVWTHYYLLAFAPLLAAGVSARWLVGFTAATWVFTPPFGVEPLSAVLLAPYPSNSPRAVILIGMLLASWALVLWTSRPSPAEEYAEPEPQLAQSAHR